MIQVAIALWAIITAAHPAAGLIWMAPLWLYFEEDVLCALRRIGSLPIFAPRPTPETCPSAGSAGGSWASAPVSTTSTTAATTPAWEADASTS